MINHDAVSCQDIADAFAGQPVGNLTRGEVLGNVTFAWLASAGVSSARLYWENTAGFLDVKDVSVPSAPRSGRCASGRPGHSRHG